MDGTPFGHYRLLDMVGQGGMGQVYRAFDTLTNRVVALKVLPAHLAEDRSFRQRFLREAQVAAGLSEPHIVPIHRFGDIDGRLYVDMRLIEGHDLQNEIGRGVLDPSRAVDVVEQIGQALDAAHAAGLVHRDVKPSNILLTDADFAYLIDFGIARGTDQTALTSVGSTVGTLAYMAPERFDTGESDGRSDVYSLACVLFECVTGRLAFPGKSVEQQIAAHVIRPAPRPSDVNRALSARLDDVVLKGLAKNPDDRYRTCAELIAAARAAVSPAGSAPAPPPLPLPPAPAPARMPSSPVPTPPTREAIAWTPTRPRAPEPLGWAPLPQQRQMPDRRRRYLIAGVAALVVVVLVVVVVAIVGPWRDGYGGNASKESSTSSSTSSTRSSSVTSSDGSPPAPAGKVASIAATVPVDIAASGRLTVGVNSPYEPNEFKDSNGKLVGFDVDLMNAVAATLGLTADYREVGFATIIPSVQSGDINVGMSSFTDTKEREKVADFVTYFSAGTLWAQRSDSSVDPANGCGKRIAVQALTVQATDELPGKSKACTDAGKPAIDIVSFDAQAGATNALLLGQADAMSADSPVTSYAIQQSDGKLVAAGQVFDTAPYGWPVRKGSSLGQSLLQALQHLIETGAYRQIATDWGAEVGMIDTPVINGAS